MEQLYNFAIKYNLQKEYNELVLWNNNKKDRPLDLFTNDWLQKNAIIESDDLYSLAITIKNELTYKHALLICLVLSTYDVIYANLFVAEYYELNNQNELAISYYKKCLDDYEATNLVREKLKKLENKD